MLAVAALDVNSAPTESAWNPMYAKPISIVLVLDYVKTECAGMDVWTITIVRPVAPAISPLKHVPNKALV